MVSRALRVWLHAASTACLSAWLTSSAVAQAASTDASPTARTPSLCDAATHEAHYVPLLLEFRAGARSTALARLRPRDLASGIAPGTGIVALVLAAVGIGLHVDVSHRRRDRVAQIIAPAPYPR